MRTNTILRHGNTGHWQGYAPNMAFSAGGLLFDAPVGFGQKIVVQPWEQVLVFRDGRVIATLGSGAHRTWKRGVRIRRVDLRPRLIVTPAQEIPTADGITIKVTAAARVRIADAEQAVLANQEPEQVLYLAVQLALRDNVAVTSVEALVANRAAIGPALVGALRGVEELGYVVDQIDLKDVILPADLKKAQAEVLVARASGVAALERARGETAALRSLANAARLAQDNPALLSLRLIQELGATTGHTVVLGPAALGLPAS